MTGRGDQAGMYRPRGYIQIKGVYTYQGDIYMPKGVYTCRRGYIQGKGVHTDQRGNIYIETKGVKTARKQGRVRQGQEPG